MDEKLPKYGEFVELIPELMVDKDDIIRKFEVDEKELDGITFIYGAFDDGGWDATAHIIFVRDGKLWEVNASHCSCDGFEGQWGPDETSIEAFKMRTNQLDNFDKINWDNVKSLLKGNNND